MSFGFKLLPAAFAAALLFIAPDPAFADRKDGEKQRREKWDDRERDRVYRNDDNRYGREGWGDWPDRTKSEKEWRKERKEREKDRREALREREKDRREAAREWEKDHREAQREWDKNRRRDARRNVRDRDYRYPQTNRLP